ncbi:MAG: hypothetical protein JXR15_07625 [Shimia sp.]|uniref:hypothetical protein n=1 Tax=Shimia sp. TaxID=1954381 RepID=UPI003B8D53BF
MIRLFGRDDRIQKRTSTMTSVVLAAGLGLLLSTSAAVQEVGFPTVFTNVHGFAGLNEGRIENASVLTLQRNQVEYGATFNNTLD